MVILIFINMLKFISTILCIHVNDWLKTCDLVQVCVDFVGGVPASNDKRLISRAPMWHTDWICMSAFPFFAHLLSQLFYIISWN